MEVGGGNGIVEEKKNKRRVEKYKV